MVTTDKSGIAFFIETCLKFGMNHVVCSPGSRNAPIVISLDEHPDIETIVIHDERSAGFYALGMSLILNAPVGIVCTSGSALLNYYPAVAEAYYQCVPLVVMSADRPEEWVNHGDGQTIVQTGVYKNHIRHEVTIDEELSSEADNINLFEKISSAFQEGNTGWKGPIHFNFPINEPLYNTKEVDHNKIEAVHLPELTLNLSEDELVNIKKAWSNYGKKMILCGQLKKNPYLNQLLADLATDQSVAVLVENTSNLNDQRFIHCIDRTLAGIHPNEWNDFQPDLLITIGESVISKNIKQFLRQSNVKEHWKVGFAFPDMDTYRKKTHSFICNPSEFFRTLLNIELPFHGSSFGSKWKQRDYIIQDGLLNYYASIPYADLSVYEMLLDYLPDDSNLHMANSSVVRYCQLFNPIASVVYFSNRGTSGIDGSTSTACGAALVSKNKWNVLLTGDVSFFYDSNALWSDNLLGNLRIVLIHNGGGGIFRIIPGPTSTKQLEKYFEAKHNFSAEYLCKAFNVSYSSAKSLADIENTVPSFFNGEINDRPKLLEIFTDSLVNDKVLKSFFDKAKSLVHVL